MRKIIAVCFLLFVYCTANALTLKDIRSQIRRHMGDLNSTSAQEIWQDTELDFLINQGQRVTCDRTWCIIKSTTISLATDTTYYNLPSDFYVSKRVEYGTSLLNETVIEKLDRDSDSWLSTSTGTPANYYINSERTQVGMYPVPDSTAATTIIMWYLPVPADLTSDSDIPFNGIYKLYSYHHLLVYYSLAHIMFAEGNPNAATWFNLYNLGVARMEDNIKVKLDYSPDFLFERE